MAHQDPTSPDENHLIAERRAKLEEVLAGVSPPLLLTPVTRDREVAADWFERFEGAGFDGVIVGHRQRVVAGRRSGRISRPTGCPRPKARRCRPVHRH